MMLENRPIYKCDLLIIKSDSRINCDQSLHENLKNAETEVAIELLVQPSCFSQGYYKEIITGKKIPIYRVQEHLGDYYSIENFYFHLTPHSPYFIKYKEKILGEQYLGNDLVEATLTDVEDYVASHSKEEMASMLDEIFKEGKERYRSLIEKGEVSDSKKINVLLKK